MANNVPHNTKPASRQETGKEFDFTRADFERVRGLIYQRAGISLADSKQEMVYSAACAPTASPRSRPISTRWKRAACRPSGNRSRTR
jgi:hypothetical protein